MKNVAIVVLILFLLLGSAESFAQNRFGVMAILVVKDTNGTAVHRSPGRKISGRIKACFDCEGKVPVQLIDARPGWLKVLWDSTNVGWVRTGPIGVYTKRPLDGRIRVLLNPSKNSTIRAELSDVDRFAQILSFRGNWVLVRVMDANKKWVQGWLPPDCQCPEPHTSCT